MSMVDWPADLLAEADEVPAAIDAVIAAYVEPSQKAGLRAYIRAEIQARRLALTALERIKRETGRVCAEFETCEHPSCASSYSAWAIADCALKSETPESANEKALAASRRDSPMFMWREIREGVFMPAPEA